VLRSIEHAPEASLALRCCDLELLTGSEIRLEIAAAALPKIVAVSRIDKRANSAIVGGGVTNS
jgi:hypothetical protein